MIKKFLAVLTLSSFFSVCYAIQVKVESPSAGVYAVGFKVNGVEYGGVGKTYSAKDMPANAIYTFGMRVGGLIIGAKDIECITVNGGAAAIPLHSDTKAVLMYDGNQKCYVEIYSI